MIDISKKTILQFFLIIIAVVFTIRLFFLQIIDNEYKIASYTNTVQKFIEHPYRGEIFDRNNNIIVFNEPIYDLYIIPNKVRINKKFFCETFQISLEAFNKKLKKSISFSNIKESVFIKSISHIDFSKIQHLLTEFRGFHIKAKTIRNFVYPTLGPTIGYLAETTSSDFKMNRYYNLGDLKGYNGLEKQYESLLRGSKGTVYKFIDVKGIDKGNFKKGLYDTPTISGKKLITTIDIDLQNYCDKLMKNKVGSIIVLEPKTGEILSIGSYPLYDPNLLKGKNFSKNFKILKNNLKYPLFDRSIMAMYPPGSIFKVVNALIALKEKVITPNTTYSCLQNLVKCHKHNSPSNLHNAIKNSCNPYFFNVFRKIMNQYKYKNKYKDTRYGFEKWRNYVLQFGFGQKLDIDIPNEKTGYIPTSQYYDNKYGFQKWKISTIRSLDIGQGELLLTPLQMVNLAAILANRGYYITPHLTKSIGDQKNIYKKKVVNIDKKYFEFVVDAMAETTKATAKLAYIDDIVFGCKTGTAENPHGKDHAVFIGFAPKENPKMALVVFVENGGWGSVGAAPLGGLIIEKFLKGNISKKRQWIENYVLSTKNIK